MIRPKSPISLQIELTDFCNHNCVHCYNFWRTDDSWKKEADKVNGKKLLDIADKIIDAEVFHVVLTGGEPLVVPLHMLEPLVKKYRDNNVSVSMNSNITLVTPEHVDFLKKYGLGILTSIISSDENEFDSVTQKKGSFKKFNDKLELLTKNDIHVSANMVVDKSRVSKVYETGKLAYSLGVKGFCATRMSPSNENIKNYKSAVLDNNDITSMFDQLLALEKNFGIPVATLNAIPYCALDNPEKYSSLLHRSCMAGLTSAGVSSKGELRSCQHFNTSGGNVLSENIRDIWDKMFSWRQEYISQSSCKSCIECTHCGGGCRENALKMSGELFGEDSVKRTPLTKRLSSSNATENIDAIKIYPRMKYRNEEFGGILFKNAGAYGFVDLFSFETIKNLYSRDVITQNDIIEIGSNLPFVNKQYTNNLFNNLVNNKIAYKEN